MIESHRVMLLNVCCFHSMYSTQVVQALAAAMRSQLEGWLLRVTQLEALQLKGQLSLAALGFYCAGPAASLELLADVAVGEGPGGGGYAHVGYASGRDAWEGAALPVRHWACIAQGRPRSAYPPSTSHHCTCPTGRGRVHAALCGGAAQPAAC